MNERAQEILRNAQTLRQAGWDEGRVSSWINAQTAGAYRSMDQLSQAVQAGEARLPAAQMAADAVRVQEGQREQPQARFPLGAAPTEEFTQDEARQEIRDRGHMNPGRLAAFTRGGLQGATVGFGDEIMGTVRGTLGMEDSVGEGIEAEREELDLRRTAHPIATGAGEIAGSLLPFSAGLRGVGLLGRGVMKTLGKESASEVLPKFLQPILKQGPLAGRARDPATRGAGLREVEARAMQAPLSPVREGAAVAGRIGAQGAASGAAVGGLFGVGEAEGGPMERAAAVASEPGRVVQDAAVGGIMAGLFGGPAAARTALKTRDINRHIRPERIARGTEDLVFGSSQQASRKLSQSRADLESPAAREAVDNMFAGARRPSDVVRISEGRAQEVSRTMFRKFDEATNEAGILMTPKLQEVFKAPPLQEARAALARTSAPTPRLQQFVDGDAPPRFVDIQGVRSRLQGQAQSFREGGGVNVRDVQAARRIEGLIDDFDDAVMDAFSQMDLPDLGVARSQYRLAVQAPDYMNRGRTVAAKSADDIQDAIKRISDPEFQQAFRIGAIHEIAEGMGRASPTAGGIRMNIRDEEKLRALFPSDKKFSEFKDLIDKEVAAARFDEIGDLLIKAAGFLFGGTSIFGGVAATLGGG